MRVVRSSRFDRAYRKLPPEIKTQFKEKLRLLVESDFAHPSLRVKRIKATERVWEASITMEYRFTFQKIENGILLRVIGTHEILKQP